MNQTWNLSSNFKVDLLQYESYLKIDLNKQLMNPIWCIALPVPSIVQNFHRIYTEDKVKNPTEMKELLSDDPELVDRLKRRFVHSAISRVT